MEIHCITVRDFSSFVVGGGGLTFTQVVKEDLQVKMIGTLMGTRAFITQCHISAVFHKSRQIKVSI